ncbi:MAG: helix-turn-helix transcriptional regulator [Oscillospiraceae bacterium]|jgi:transcriptional regulator with XRE-family HTH domain|nr:helix-turn-helix transcriptional regulator [Oscillospiraceae bacterium]
MALFNVNTLIKELRLGIGMSQAKLAEGICSRETISKIENGERKPDWYISQNVLLRLGIKLEQLQSETMTMLSESESHIVKKRDECQQALSTYNLDALKAILDGMANDKHFQKGATGRGYSIYLKYKASLHMYGQYKDPEKCRDYAIEYIKINRPDFDINKLTSYFLSQDELLVLNLAAVAYAEIDGIDRALEIWFMLKETYERQFDAGVHENPRYRELVINICVSLKKAERYEECLEFAEKGLVTAITYHDMRIYILCLYQKAYSLIKLGRMDEGKELYKKFLMFTYVVDGFASFSFDLAKKEYEETFGCTFETTGLW